jgi:hypothetical protein
VRSLRDAGWLNRAAAALLLAVAGSCACAQPASSTPAPTREQVQQAVERVRADPLLGHTETRKTLRFKKREDKQEDPQPRGDWRWLGDLMRWLAQTMRIAVWLFGAFVAALMLLRLHRWMRARGVFEPAPRAMPPSHVQNLDIRPESLPDAIGAAAAALWRRGEQRAALSLLYRGALSRLVHGYALPIRAASTEGECLRLAGERLDAPRAAFFARLIDVWLHAVYGAQMPEAAQALALCGEFDLQLAPAPSALPAAPGGRTA